MSQPAALTMDSRNAVNILSVTPYEEDQFSLQDIMSHSKWRLYTADRLESALAFLHANEVGVVLSECQLPPHSWTGILDVIHHAQDAPALIVTSRLADDRLWVEAVELGAYDVLAKPFNRDEVLRTVSLAWLNWQRNHQVAAAGTGANLKSNQRSPFMSKQSTNRINVATRPAPTAGHSTVEAIAYQLWLQRGCPIGSDQEDWYRAEAELKDAKRTNPRAA